MADCDLCGERVSGLAWDCNYCTGSYCRDHRFPENHDCPGVTGATTHGPDFRTEGSARVPEETEDLEVIEHYVPEEDDSGRWLTSFLLISLLSLTALGLGWFVLSLIYF